MSDIIRTEHLTFAYPPDEGKDPVPALDGVDLSIRQALQPFWATTAPASPPWPSI